MKNNLSLCLDKTPLWHHHLGVFYSFLLDIACIKHVVISSIVNSFINMIFKAVINYSYKGGEFLSKVIIIFLFIINTSKQTNWPTSTLNLLIWSNKSSLFCIIHVKHLLQIKDNVWQVLHLINVTKSLLYLCWSFAFQLVCTTWLFAKLSAMMDIASLTRLLYYFFNLGSALENGVSSYLSTMSQRSMKAKPISNLNF